MGQDTDRRRIFLIGPMGAGKTTIGKRLAKSSGMRFIDCDQEIERRTGVNIGLIFDIEGEDGFRSREKKLLLELTRRDNIVLATGGGAVLDADNRAALASRGWVVYLFATPENLLGRIRDDTSRPLLQVEDREQKLRQLFAERDPLYREVADLILDTGDLVLPAILKRIRRELAAWSV